jgi:hypothetical protein
MTSTTETVNKVYLLSSFIESCLIHAMSIDLYLRDVEVAGDEDLVVLFRCAKEASRRCANDGKAMLAQWMSETADA